jgi:GNAT superfamily N-acetyltransferase
MWPEDPGGWLSPRGLLDAWVAEVDGAVCGHIALAGGVADEQLIESSQRPPSEIAAVLRFFVAPAARTGGLGRVLLGTVTGSARERDLGLVLDVVDEPGSAAIALYERLGWQLVGQRAADWVTPDGVRPRVRLYVLRD